MVDVYTILARECLPCTIGRVMSHRRGAALSRGLLGASLALLFLAADGCAEPGPTVIAPQTPTTAAPTASGSATAAQTKRTTVDRMIADAEALRQFVKSEGAKQFLSRAATLPKIATRPLYRLKDRTRYFTESEAMTLSPDARTNLEPFAATEEIYYYTGYGSPLSYSRALDLLFTRGVNLPPGSKLLDFGYGYIGHLKMLASTGIDTTGIDPGALLRALYSFPGDQGPVSGPNGERGSVRLLNGYFPADPKTVEEVGAGYHLILSKNTLKRGYIHPERPMSADLEKKLIRLGASDEAVLKAFFDALAPGGHFMIYNICPAPTPPDKPFIPWTDGRSPWTRTQWETAGFEVLVFDQDDTEAVRVMGHTLGWDLPEDGEPGMDLINDLSVLYTLVRRPAAK